MENEKIVQELVKVARELSGKFYGQEYPDFYVRAYTSEIPSTESRGRFVKLKSIISEGNPIYPGGSPNWDEARNLQKQLTPIASRLGLKLGNLLSNYNLEVEDTSVSIAPSERTKVKFYEVMIYFTLGPILNSYQLDRKIEELF